MLRIASITRAHAMCTIGALLAVGCSENGSIDPRGSDVALEMTASRPAELIAFATEVEIDDPGPFSTVGSTAYSRCPDQSLATGEAQLLRLNWSLAHSMYNPDYDPADEVPKPFIHWTVPVEILSFTGYRVQGTVTSEADYTTSMELLSNDRSWAAPFGHPVALRCRYGTYFPPNPVVKYSGRLTVIDFPTAGLRRIFLEEDGPAPTESCDDPLTDEVETDACGSTQASTATGSREVVEFAPPNGPVGGWKLMCDVVFWYQAEEVGGPLVFQGTEILWNTCQFEAP